MLKVVDREIWKPILNVFGGCWPRKEIQGDLGSRGVLGVWQAPPPPKEFVSRAEVRPRPNFPPLLKIPKRQNPLANICKIGEYCIVVSKVV